MKRRLKGEEERGGWDMEMVKDQDTVGVEDGKQKE